MTDDTNSSVKMLIWGLLIFVFLCPVTALLLTTLVGR
jgi:hypothetical protein